VYYFIKYVIIEDDFVKNFIKILEKGGEDER
jgi:hypothetical protein